MSRSRRFTTANLSDEHVAQMMESDQSGIESSDGDSSVGDSSGYNYLSDDDDEEVGNAIEDAVQQMNAGETSHAFIDGIDISALEIDAALPSAASTYVLLDEIDLMSSNSGEEMQNVPIEILPIVFAEPAEPTTSTGVSTSPQPSTSTATVATAAKKTKKKPFKPKRVRSPLPIFDPAGPSFTPNNGGFKGDCA